MSDIESEPILTYSDSIGPYLKKTRETQGFSLDQVASLTRIQAKFIQALEDEQFQQLPEQVFTRGFVRTYARSLGVNEEDALRRFSESSREFYQQGQQAQHRAQLEQQEARRGKLNRNLVIIVTIVIIVALGFLLPRQQQSPPPSDSLVQEGSPPEVSPPASTDPAKVPLEVPARSSEPEGAENVSGENAEIRPSASPAPVVPTTPAPEPPQSSIPVTAISTDPLRLEIEATQLTWVVVQSDDKNPKEALLQPGQQADWEAQQQFTLTLGNAAGVIVRLNGETRGPFGNPGEVVRDVILKP